VAGCDPAGDLGGSGVADDRGGCGVADTGALAGDWEARDRVGSSTSPWQAPSVPSATLHRAAIKTGRPHRSRRLFLSALPNGSRG
jgi:hypothetical protein